MPPAQATWKVFSETVVPSQCPAIAASAAGNRTAGMPALGAHRAIKVVSRPGVVTLISASTARAPLAPGAEARSVPLAPSKVLPEAVSVASSAARRARQGWIFSPWPRA